MSFHDLEIYRGLRAHPIFLCAIFICGIFETPHTWRIEDCIRENIREIGEETLVKVEANFRKRLQICARENDHHLSDIIFRF